MEFAGLEAVDTRTKSQAGVRVPINDLGGKPLLNAKKEEMGLLLYGPDSEAFRAATRDLTRSRLERTRNRKGDELPKDADLDAAESDQLNFVIAMTAGWYGILNSKGDENKFSKQGARQLYESYPVVREQAEQAVQDRKIFTKA